MPHIKIAGVLLGRSGRYLGKTSSGTPMATHRVSISTLPSLNDVFEAEISVSCKISISFCPWKAAMRFSSIGGQEKGSRYH